VRKIFGIAVCSLLLVCVASAQDFGPWSAPVNLGSTINSGFNDMHPALSKDGLSRQSDRHERASSRGRSGLGPRFQLLANHLIASSTSCSKYKSSNALACQQDSISISAAFH
jgi:hypothetical protein